MTVLMNSLKGVIYTEFTSSEAACTTQQDMLQTQV